MAVWALIVWMLAPATALEHDPGLYRHFLIPLFVFLIAIPLLIMKLMAWLTLRRIGSSPKLRDFLPHVSLFAKAPELPKLDFFTAGRAFVLVPIQYPLQLLFVPSLFVLFLPYYLSIRLWALVALLAWWLILSSFADHRIGNALHLLRRAFFIGGQLVVSLVVIVLAVGRVMESSYVQTVVESSNWKTMLSYLASAYIVFWFNEYWLNRIFLERLLRLISRPNDPPGSTDYNLKDPKLIEGSKIEPNCRRIQIHGGARFVSIGKLKSSSVEMFEPFEKSRLFDEIVRKASWTAVGSKARSAESLEKLQQIHRGGRFYFSFANLLLIVLAVASGFYLSGGVQHAALKIPAPAVMADSEDPDTEDPDTGVSTQPFDFADSLWNQERDKVILLAASGGGTRAALYTHSVLHGFDRLGVLDDVVLGSGVSGGGTALAYLGAHYEELVSESGNPTAKDWNDFSCTVGSPFIWDVLEGVSEWRIVTGTRAGKLLQESFARSFRVTPVPSLGQAHYGLIFNTGLVGRLQVTDNGNPDDGDAFAGLAADRRVDTDGSIGGGRLILTNLQDAHSAFRIDHPGLNLPYVVIQDLNVPLNTAAALHANFPPVFSNAPIDDLSSGHRYWVTDGGAVENRGLISLLLALRGELLAQHEVRETEPPAHLPEIHIVMAEASAGSRRYSQDRGIGAAFGASGKVANQLLRELLEEVKALYGGICVGSDEASGDAGEDGNRCGKVVYHDLPMPELLRIDSGLGTHWMMPRTVEMLRGEESVVLDSPAVRWLVDALHQNAPKLDLDKEPPRCSWEGGGRSGLLLEGIRVALGRMEPRDKRLEKVYDWARNPEEKDSNFEETYMASSHKQGWDRFRCLYAGEDCPSPAGD